MNYTKLFYWLTVADNARTMFIVFIVIFTLISAISTISYLCNHDDKDNQAMARKWMWWAYPFMIVFWSLFIFTPSKRDSLLIVAGGGTLNYLTTDSVTKQIPREMSNFVLTELKNLAADAKMDLNIANQKDKMMEKAKTMTSEQLLNEMKLDSNFRKIILNQ